MSPVRTLISCGSSSSFSRRNQPPICVTRGSTPTVSGMLCEAASGTMVRNFQMRNGRPRYPTRLCRKKTGPRSSSLIKNAIASKSGQSSARPSTPNTTSKTRFSSLIASRIGTYVSGPKLALSRAGSDANGRAPWHGAPRPHECASRRRGRNRADIGPAVDSRKERADTQGEPRQASATWTSASRRKVVQPECRRCCSSVTTRRQEGVIGGLTNSLRDPGRGTAYASNAGRTLTSTTVLAHSAGLAPMSKVAFSFLWCFVFFLPWDEVIHLPVWGSLPRVVGVVASVAGVLHIVARGRIRPPSWFNVLGLLFVLWAGASSLWSIDPDATRGRFLSYLQLLLLAW